MCVHTQVVLLFLLVDIPVVYTDFIDWVQGPPRAEWFAWRTVCWHVGVVLCLARASVATFMFGPITTRVVFGPSMCCHVYVWPDHNTCCEWARGGVVAFGYCHLLHLMECLHRLSYCHRWSTDGPSMVHRLLLSSMTDSID